MSAAIQMTKQDLSESKKEEVLKAVEERLLDLLLPSNPVKKEEESTATN